jgi:hypothetical protein
MTNEVYANSREVSCKSGKGKAACAFPDTCFTPPAPPPTGAPIPYPNTGVDADSSNGSRSVKISKKEVMLKNKSYFKKSVGDEAGRAPKKGVLTTVNGGKVFFNAWSMDVKFEGENIVRHMDLTTHNHASPPGNTPTWPFLSGSARTQASKCGAEKQKADQACKGVKNPCASLGRNKPSGLKSSKQASRMADKSAGNRCLSARRCILQPYKPNKCCPPQTGHHLIEASALHDTGRGGKGSKPLQGIKLYREGKAPCVCAEGVNQHTGTHGLMHTLQSAAAAKCANGTLSVTGGGTVAGKVTTYGEARDSGIKAFQKVFSRSKCSKKCLQAQVDDYHRRCGLRDNTKIKAVETGQTDVSAAAKEIQDRIFRVGGGRASAPAPF